MMGRYLVLAVLVMGCAEGNRPPVLLPVGPRLVEVGQTLEITILGSDPDQDGVTFGVRGLPFGAAFSDRGLDGYFLWVPQTMDLGPELIPKDHFIVFTITDANGAEDSEAVMVTVVPGDLVQPLPPYFVSPSEFALDLQWQNSLAMAVEVGDDDSEVLEIWLESGPEGGEFLQWGERAGTLTWVPTPEDILGDSSLFTFVLGARDFAAPDVFFEIHVLLLGKDQGGDCEGDDPVISHTPLGDQRTDEDYMVTALIAQGERAIQSATLYWTAGDPEESSPEGLTMALTGSSWSALIPNLELGVGEAATVSYIICATDGDGEGCSQTACLPDDGSYLRFMAYAPGGPDEVCTDDVLEENDDMGEAASLEPGLRSGLRWCPDDVDWYTLALAAGDTLDVALSSATVTGLAVELYSLEGGFLAGGGESLSYLSAEGGPVAFAVMGGSQAGFYDLDVRVTAGTIACRDDAYEPNDDASSATELEPGTYPDRQICPDNPDWYVLTLEEGDTVRVMVSFAAGQGDLDAVLYDRDGQTVLQTRATRSDNEEVEVQVEAAGDYYLKIHGYEGASNVYGLVVTITSLEEECGDDGFEDNDDSGQARGMAAGNYSGLHICPGDHDWYSVDVGADEYVSVRVGTIVASGDLDLEVFGASGAALLGRSATSADQEFVEVLVEVAQRVWIHVFGAGEGVENSYEMTIGLRPGQEPCDDDRYEENDNIGQSTELRLDAHGNYYEAGLMHCEDDDDWYTFPADAGQEIRVSISFDHLEGDLNLYLYDPMGREIGRSVTWVNDGEFLQPLASVSGAYYIRVGADVPGQRALYSVDIEITGP